MNQLTSNQPIVQSTNQSINQSTNEEINNSINQSRKQSSVCSSHICANPHPQPPYQAQLGLIGNWLLVLLAYCLIVLH